MKHSQMLLLLAAVLSPGWAHAAGPSQPETPAAAVTRIGAKVLVKQAWETQVRLVRATRSTEGDVPQEFWGEAIKELKPVRVYMHNVNVVVVLRASGPTEEGLYIYIPISSYIPMTGDGGFTFTNIAPDVFAYRRGPPSKGPERECRFGIFMPREDICHLTADVEQRINTYLKSKPQDIPIAEYPFVSDQDIQSYDWKTHTLAVDKSVLRRVRQHAPSLRGAPFVVVADGEPVYVGAFYTAASSFSCPVPVILVDGFLTQGNTLTIDRAYPGELPDMAGHDPRAAPRIKKALQSLGKLRE